MTSQQGGLSRGARAYKEYYEEHKIYCQICKNEAVWHHIFARGMGYMNILITTQDYSQLTGAEMYIYELSRELVVLGHQVTISARRVGGLIKLKSEENNVKVVSFGDVDNRVKYDVIHLNTPHASIFIAIKFKGTPMVYTSHSEYHVEKPLYDYPVKKYIAIREAIRNKWQFKDCVVIPNPIDFSRFNELYEEPDNERPIILFPATFEPLRVNAVRHLVDKYVKLGFDILFCGIRMVNGYEYDYIEPLLGDNVKWVPPIWSIEKLIKKADIIAGIEVGRTTIEGWCCGKAGLVYYLDYDKAFREKTEIHNVVMQLPPSDIHKYDSRRVVREVEEVYREAIG